MAANVSSPIPLTNATAIGYGAVATLDNEVRVGNSAVTLIDGQVTFTGSDGRFKADIRNEVKGLEFINRLHPVVYNFEAKKFDSFRMKNLTQDKREQVLNSLDYTEAELMRRSGFIAQEVEQAANDAGYTFDGVHVAKDENDNYSLAYSQFVVPLVKAVQELDSISQIRDKNIEELKYTNESLQKEIDELKLMFARLQSIIPLENSNQSELNVGIATDNFYLGQNVPNPFDNSTIIPFKIPSNCISALIQFVENATGKTIKTIPVTCNQSQIEIEAGTLASGSYSYVLIVDGRLMDTKQMIISK